MTGKKCPHQYEWSAYCGARVCALCGDHRGLARCFCGWNLKPGERLEDDIGNARFSPDNGWTVEY